MDTALLPKTGFHDVLETIGDRLVRGVTDTRAPYEPPLSRLLLNLPPRHGSTTFVARLLAKIAHHSSPAYTPRTLLIGYDCRLPKRTRLDAQTAYAEQYGREWPASFDKALDTDAVGAHRTGRGFDLVIVDSPYESPRYAEDYAVRMRTQEWLDNALLTRLTPKATAIIIGPRMHYHDVFGELTRRAADEPWTQWTLVPFKALWTLFEPPFTFESNTFKAPLGDPAGRKEGDALCPQMYGRERLLKILNDIGPEWFLTLYQQTPLPPDWYRQHYEHHPFLPDWLKPYLPEAEAKAKARAEADADEQKRHGFTATPTPTPTPTPTGAPYKLPPFS